MAIGLYHGADSRKPQPCQLLLATQLKGKVRRLLAAGLQDSAEFGRIGRYYATESMLVWDPKKKEYVADATPSYGKDTLEAFFQQAVKEGLKGQELGDAAVF